MNMPVPMSLRTFSKITERFARVTKQVAEETMTEAALDLKVYIHGYTQNQNESFHSMIWTRVPKMTHASLKTFEFAILDAVATFNVGRKSTLDVYIYIYKIMNIDPGKYTESGCQMLNQHMLSFW